jgi:hypothetical protein
VDIAFRRPDLSELSLDLCRNYLYSTSTMAIDHYVARTYLKHWCDQDAGRPLRAYRKSNGAEFPCWPANVCGERNGDLNPKYLAEPNALGVFRDIWEPRWNEGVDAFRSGKYRAAHTFVLAAGWASMSLTTPATTAIGTEALEKDLQTLLHIVEHGMRLDVDPEFAKAIFTQALPSATWRLLGQSWVILLNSTDEPFLTSDNPSAMVGQDLLGSPPARILPLSPDMCVSTLMDFNLVVPKQFTLEDLISRIADNISFQQANLEQVRFVNIQTVKHAGDLIFSSKADAGVAALVASLRQSGVPLDHSAMSMDATKAVLAIARTGIEKVR